MVRISNIEEYYELFEKYESCTNWNNGLLMPTEAMGLIESDKLYYRELTNGCAFIRKENDFDKVTLYLNESEPREYQSDSITIVEYLSKKDNTDYKEHIEILKKMGFEYYLTNVRWNIKLEGYFTSSEYCSPEFTFRLAKVSESYKVLKLMSNSLDIYDSIIPSVEELEKWIDEGLIYCLSNKSDEIVAAARLKADSKRQCSIWLVLVDSNYRGYGLAKMLLTGMLESASKKAFKKAYLWVDEKNISMIKTINKIGFEKDILKSTEYIKK